MLYAVMSDIHANPQALARALADAREQGAEKFICLGDVWATDLTPWGRWRLRGRPSTLS